MGEVTAAQAAVKSTPRTTTTKASGIDRLSDLENAKNPAATRDAPCTTAASETRFHRRTSAPAAHDCPANTETPQECVCAQPDCPTDMSGKNKQASADEALNEQAVKESLRRSGVGEAAEDVK